MKLRIGIIGTGPKERTNIRGGGFAIGRVHADAWKQITSTELSAACDINKENLEAFSNDYGVTGCYTDYNKMLKEEKLDIVDICTWPILHYEMAKAAIAARVKGIYMEKPMCLSFGEAKEIVDSCRCAGIKLCVSHQRRYEPDFIKAREWIKEGKVGKVLEVDAVIAGEDADLLSWGTHWFDMFNYLLDDQQTVSVFAQTDCTSGKIRYGHRVEDAALVEVVYKDGTRCYLRGDYDFNQPSHIRIIGQKGMIEVGDDGLKGMFDGESKWIYYLSNEENAYIASFVKAMNDLVDSIKEERTPYLNGMLALKTTEIIMAAYESSEKRARINLPLKRFDFPLKDRNEFKE